MYTISKYVFFMIKSQTFAEISNRSIFTTLNKFVIIASRFYVPEKCTKFQKFMILYTNSSFLNFIVRHRHRLADVQIFIGTHKS